MTQSDKWKRGDAQRPEVARYFAYKQDINLKANLQRYRIGSQISIDFYIPMPKSWSKKQRDKMRGTPCKVKPDTDNLIKAFKDALTTEDARIWDEHARKFWSDKGYIHVTRNEFDENESDDTQIVIIKDKLKGATTRHERKNRETNPQVYPITRTRKTSSSVQFRQENIFKSKARLKIKF